MYSRPHAKPTANNNLSVFEAYILVDQFSHIMCMRTQSNRDAKFSNPPTHTSFDHPEYLGQPDSYGDIPGHEVFSFLDLRVLWTLKSSLVLIFGMSFVDRKNPTKMVREANGQYDSIRAKFVKRCNLSGSLELQFLNLRKASRSFDRNLTQLHAKKIISKINNGTFYICRFLFRQCCENSKCYIYSGGRFLCRSLEAVIFCCLISFSAVYSSFDIQSYFQLVYSTNMGIISLFIEV